MAKAVAASGAVRISAPRASMRARRQELALRASTTTTRTPRPAPAVARAMPWLPELTVTTPLLPRPITWFSAPRNLNAPEVCRNSSFSVDATPGSPIRAPSIDTTGVRTTCGARRAAAAAIAWAVTDADVTAPREAGRRRARAAP